MPESKYKVGDIIQFRSNQPMRHLNKMFSHDADDNVMDVDEYIGVITDVSFFYMDGDTVVYTYDATTTRSPFEGFDCSFNCMLVDRDILRVLKEDELTEGELFATRSIVKVNSHRNY